MSSQIPVDKRASLNQVMALPGLAAQILGMTPLLRRVQLRRTCRSFLSAADESLEGIHELFLEDIGDLASKPGGLDWLLPKCPNLRTLSLGSRADHGRLLDACERPKLKWPPPPGTTKQLLLGLGHCRHLRCLNLSGCADAGDDLLAVVAASCRELEVLDVSYTDVTNKSLPILASYLRHLKELRARGARKVADAGLQEFANRCAGRQQLETLVLSKVSVTDAGVSAIIRHCPRLRHLDVSKCFMVTDASLCTLAAYCPTLQYLGVGGLGHVTDAGIIVVVNMCPDLRSLDANGCGGVSDASVKALSKRCTSGSHALERLAVMSTRVGSASVLELAARCPQLRHLELGDDGEDAVTDRMLALLAERCPLLEHLVLRGAGRVTDSGICAIARGWPRLRHLDIQECYRVYDGAVRVLGQHCPLLEHVTITSNDGELTECGLGVLARSCGGTLRCLDLSRAGLSECGLRAVVENCGQLERLVISSDEPTLENFSAAAIGRNCVRLRSLEAHACNWLKDGDIAAMLSGPAAARLSMLDFSHNEKITNGALMTVGRLCPLLRSLRLAKCDRITDVGILAVARGCRRLARLEVSEMQGVTEAVLNVFVGSECKVIMRYGHLTVG